MATRKSTREVPSSRNRSSQDRPGRDLTGGAAAAPKPAGRPTAVAAIEAARTRLMRARAVLDCMHYVLLYDDHFDGDPKRPSFADAIDVARDLVSEVIDALDRVNLRRTGVTEA